jgi:hypothetical protein
MVIARMDVLRRSGRPAVRWVAAAVLLASAGCATVQPPQRGHLDSADPGLAECARWFETLDAAVTRSAVNDIGARRVTGFPYLRINRFLAAMKGEARSDARVREAWLDAMQALDRVGRGFEIANLPRAQVDRLAGGGRDRLAARTRECATRLMAADSANDQAVDELYRRAYVADDYSSPKRAIGLYELTRLPFYAGVDGWQEDVSENFGRLLDDEVAGTRLVRYSPPRQAGYSHREVAEILARAREHPLGLVRLSDEQRDRLFATYAPTIDIETEGDFDRIGRIRWSNDATPQVDVSRPAVYRHLGYTRMNGRSLLQLVYTAWLPQRPLDGAFDLLGGHLDGIVWRVTLAPDGEPVLFDSIHPCGCYHMFFPTPRLEAVPAPEAWMEWAFVPAELPELAGSQHITLTLETGTHYLVDVQAGETGTGDETYEFADYDELRSLPLPGGGRRSLFGPDGLVAGSERGERFLFWPMGIASPGAMRQAGTQATAFVGRRHFDDADLLEKRFRLRY